MRQKNMKRGAVVSVTIRDVAERAGVSAASVSLVLNNKECRISEETKRRIVEEANALGYSLKKTKKTVSGPRLENLIGVIFSENSDELTEECLSGIENYASIYGYYVFRMYSANQSRKCAQQIEIAAAMGAAGLIVMPPSDMNFDGNHLMLGETLKKSGIPYVLLDKAIQDVFCDFVTADNKLGMNMAIDYLMEAGHKKIGIIAGRKEVYNTRKRVEGYREGYILHGYEVDESMIYYGDYTERSGAMGAERLTAAGATALVVCNTRMAAGVCGFAKEHNLSVGEDLSVICFANIPDGEAEGIKLTCIRQPGEQMGRKAAEVLEGRICRKDLGSMKTNYFMPSLLEGKSVKVLSREA